MLVVIGWTILADVATLITAGRADEMGHKWRGHDRVNVHVQAVKKPPQPGRHARFPLLWRKLAQRLRLALLKRAGRIGLQRGHT